MVTYVKADEPFVEENNLHYMPCQIAYNGKAKTSAYFEEIIGSDGTKNASFRGRPLHGQEINIPKGYCGYVLKKPDVSFPSQPKAYQVQQSFKKFNFWNLDRIPSKNDNLLSAFDWLDVSEVLHSSSSPQKEEKTQNIKSNRK
ncbi:hypothetical protein V9T40_007789 [Parthenolecanium corni]|uniref:Uncharacterized protein n=1 Tax=Parthenolecanium corni TaxID=536013 RepID=A0AAN9Y505_9HEMI